jgi:prepilin-type N-terminal cleavage/methylation domain-containing protein
MKSKGFTLIELAVVLAIIAILAAVLTPIVMNYLDQSRIARAQADARTLADAIKLYNRDTGRWPIYNNAADHTADTALGGKAELGTSIGTAPAAGATGWVLNASLATTALSAFVNADLTGVGSTGFPKAAFRGPYMSSVESDPWGNEYLLTAANLAKSSNFHAYVISAGPNGILETTRDAAITATLAPGGDDIISVIK